MGKTKFQSTLLSLFINMIKNSNDSEICNDDRLSIVFSFQSNKQLKYVQPNYNDKR